ncbi:GNAT family N-acetyltransferase [Terribacillus saccharophilus]|uniref:GNAT family N-acetyltransferase n=1 Tax=Terribacillus saccharophilus TaxID=361277 RepID=UPI000BA69527|nr:GNAT family N-acetyltransferase [Terribacillus saccharophilus]PAF19234.1 GNAT family N-acetyltransferase [Terribacillus saccharophilus]PAF22343.1 GNAT family N-acetyltransferase [Terribacillus saccharophilus]PAF38534.1 GNAT family N-acetyltransferase [Terribacillus saccharophilus]
MGIRKAKVEDWKQISLLLNQLDYPDTKPFLKGKIETLLMNPNEMLLVFEEDQSVIAVISMHFIPQLAVKGDFARISYLAVDKNIRSKGIGRKIEEYCTDLAIKRNCDRIEVHCHLRRKDAHRFYMRQGFTESPKYFIKMLSQSD